MRMRENKFIVYCICSIIVIIGYVLLISNVDMLTMKQDGQLEYNSGVVSPYLQEENLSRFAVNDINIDMYNMDIHVFSETENFEMKVFCQGFETEDYFQINASSLSQTGKTFVYRLSNMGRVRNIYVDIYGNADTGLSVKLVNGIPEFSVKFEAIILGICILGLVIVLYRKREFIFDIVDNKGILKMLLSNDINSRYAGAFFGSAWPYVQPTISIFVFWLVFQLGFKNPPVQDMPFILWFLPAYIAWMYFQDVISYSTSCLREYSYLVKKIKFKVNIIPMIKVLAAFKIHICFVIVTFMIYAVYGMKPSIKYIQMLYYAFAMMFFLTGLSWLIAALGVFMKDMGPIISIVLQLGYFGIPIFWSEESMQPFVIKILKCNPAYYIVQGYRNSMCGGKWFWEDIQYMTYYWVVSILVFCIGLWLFDGSKKHFSDLL